MPSSGCLWTLALPNRTSNPGRGSGCCRTCPSASEQRARPLVVGRETRAGRRRRTTAGTAPGTSCARPTRLSARRTGCLRRRTHPPAPRASARRERHHAIASRCAASSSDACSSVSVSQPAAALSTARPVMRSARTRESSRSPHIDRERSVGSGSGTPGSPNPAIARASASAAVVSHRSPAPPRRPRGRSKLSRQPSTCAAISIGSVAVRRRQAGRPGRQRSSALAARPTPRSHHRTARAPRSSAGVVTSTSAPTRRLSASADRWKRTPVGPLTAAPRSAAVRPERVPRVEHQLRVLGHPVQVVRAVRRQHRDQVGAGDRVRS